MYGFHRLFSRSLTVSLSGFRLRDALNLLAFIILCSFQDKSYVADLFRSIWMGGAGSRELTILAGLGAALLMLSLFEGFIVLYGMYRWPTSTIATTQVLKYILKSVDGAVNKGDRAVVSGAWFCGSLPFFWGVVQICFTRFGKGIAFRPCWIASACNPLIKTVTGRRNG